MAKGDYIFGLDIGSSNIRSIVGEILPNLPLQVIGVHTSTSAGTRRGQIVDVEDAAETVSKNLENIERKMGETPDSLITSLGGTRIESSSSRGVVAISRADNEVSQEDVNRVIKAAEAISLPPNKEIIHSIPKEFIIDKESGIKDPVGMHGIRLEVESEIIYGPSPYIKNLEKAVEKANTSISSIVFSTLAASEAVLSKRQKELGVLVLDIGGSSTKLCVFEEGSLINASVIPIGSSHITNDIAIAFQLPIDTAEKIKLKYGAAYNKSTPKKENIDVKEIDGKEDKKISRKELLEVIEERNLEILDLVNQRLRKIKREKLLPAGTVLVGGGAKMIGIEEMVKRHLRLPCQTGFPQGVEGIVNEIDDPSFATTVGLLLWEMREKTEEKGGFAQKTNLNKYFSKVKSWFDELMP